MKVYIAGPMRGYEQYNFPAFDDAEWRLTELGVENFSPAQRDRETGFDETSMTGNEDLADHGFSLREALRADTHYICTEADALVVLPGWEKSSGALAETALAKALGLPVYALSPFLCWQAGEAETPPNLVVAAPASDEVRLVSATGGAKGSKPARHDLLPTEPLDLLARLYGKGAEKYDERNWERGYDFSLSYAANQRHMLLFWQGEDIDPEMGLPHPICAMFHAAALTQFILHPERYGQFDNRPKLS